ncbi:efflux RND transporter periplasmic adaptor subunit [Zavarzinella formosa]|uniref:efflux RND transporter periplasmic adaptor subunit n=1 Tax=Zavarzinella formosa TaxID=360055 RepID=UPI00031083DF|nr:efflux RND transporter periplasmic adaptor subunit [Zavarzinella formosa]
MRRRILGTLALGLGLGFLAGCSRPAPALAPTKPAEVIVGTPVKQIVTDYEDFTGRTEPILMVDVRARVSGYVDKIHFTDGKEVTADQPLFDIDPRTYQATLDQSIANVAQAQARLNRLQLDYDRLQTAVGTKAVTQEEFDRVTGDRNEAVASLSLAKATRNLAETNFKFTKISAPISGRISRRMMDKGNLVKADDTILTSIVALDQIYANFDIDERTMLRVRRLIQDGKVDSARSRKMEVLIGLADEDGFSQKGVIDFIDNKVDPATGTLRVRAILDNPKKKIPAPEVVSVSTQSPPAVPAPDAFIHLLSPGLFVRVRLPVGRPHEAILVPEEALGSDQGQKYVYLLNDKDEVVYRRVKIGQQVEQDRVIIEGVQPGDRVIVSGLQRVRPGVKVAPKAAETKKPSSETAAATPKAETPAHK